MNAEKQSALELEALAAAYRLYSAAFQEPSPERIEERQWRRVYAALPGGARLPKPPAPPPEIQNEFRRVFGHNLSPDCPPYETQYAHGGVFRKTQELADIAGFYRAFGLEAAAGDRRPDHLPVELEFVSLLLLKEALALRRGEREKAAISRSARGKFLGDHLGRWLPSFAAAMSVKAPEGYCAALGAALAALVGEDARSLGVDPSAPRTPAVREDPEDSVCNSCFGGSDEAS